MRGAVWGGEPVDWAGRRGSGKEERVGHEGEERRGGWSDTGMA